MIVTIPKSLHTITVIVNVARTMPAHDNPYERIESALAILGYAGTPDPYGLKDKAAGILSKQAKEAA
jgi:hypothetical protein